MLTINRTARAGLLGMIAGIGAIAILPTAEARSADEFTFAFTYDASMLDNAQGRAELDKRLFSETTKYCRNDYGSRASMAVVRSCRRDLVNAVKFALEDVTNTQTGECVSVAIGARGMRTEVCGAI